MILRAAVLCLVLVSAACATADDAFVGEAGGPVKLGHSGQIQMESERVRIRLEEGASHFRAEFHFVNHGPATTVRMGFPEDSNRPHPNEMPISHMKSWVDGKRIAIKPGAITKGGSGDTYRRYWVKTVAFAAQGRRTVVVDYDAANSADPDGNSAEYILKTGSTWDGPIKDCVISVDWEDTLGVQEPSIRTSDGLLGITPKSPRYHVYHWKNLKPKTDMDMGWEENFDNFYVDSKRVTLARAGNFSRGYLAGTGDDPDLMCACLINLDPSSSALSNHRWMHRTAKRPFVIRGHRVSFPGGTHVSVDGRVSALSKPLEDESDGGDDWETPFVRLRDVIHALGWSWHFDESTDRVFISTHPGRKR